MSNWKFSNLLNFSNSHENTSCEITQITFPVFFPWNCQKCLHPNSIKKNQIGSELFFFFWLEKVLLGTNIKWRSESKISFTCDFFLYLLCFQFKNLDVKLTKHVTNFRKPPLTCFSIFPLSLSFTSRKVSQRWIFSSFFAKKNFFCFTLASALKYPFTTRRKVSISPERRQSFRLKVMFCCVYLVLLSLQLFSDLHKHFHVFTSHDWKYVVSHISFQILITTWRRLWFPPHFFTYFDVTKFRFAWCGKRILLL